MNLQKSNTIINEFRNDNNLKHLTALDEIMLSAFLIHLEKKGYLVKNDEVPRKVFDMMIEIHSKQLDDMREFYLNQIITLLDNLLERVYNLNFCVSNHLRFSEEIKDLFKFIQETTQEYKIKLLFFKSKRRKNIDKMKKETEDEEL